MPDLCQVLTIVRAEVLSGPEKWTQGAYARNQYGHRCPVEAGVCFCFAGAVQIVLDKLNVRPEEQVKLFADLNFWMITKYTDSIISFNDRDERTFQDVAQAIDKIKEELCS